MNTASFKEHHASVRETLNKVQFTRPTHSPCSFVSGITKLIIAIGCISLLAIGLFVLHVITGTSLFRVIEISAVACLILYSTIAFCVVYNRNKLIRVHRRYPYAVDILMDIRKIEDKSIPNFFHFHKVIYDYWLFDRYMYVCSIRRAALESINNGVSILNEQLRYSCSKNRSEITRFLICTCDNKANNQSTYTKLYSKRHIPCKILSIKQILENSFKSDFAYKCLDDIVSNDLHTYPLSLSQEVYSRIIADEDEIYVFFESNKKSKGRLNVFLFVVPLILFFLPCLYIAGTYRKYYVEEIVYSNIYNAKIADAVIAKLDIIEQHIKDSIAFEERTTIPLEYSAYYDSYYSAPYVGGIYSVGNVTYNGKDYGKNGGTLMYTYGTDITITSSSVETDNIPARDMRHEVVNFSKEELRNPRQINHILEITENRGRYSGYSAGLYFKYSFSVKGPELPSNESITNKMLDTYDSSNSDINIKKIVNENFFNNILQYSAEDVLEEYIGEYLCTSIYKIDIIKEVERMKNLVENKEKYAAVW